MAVALASITMLVLFAFNMAIGFSVLGAVLLYFFLNGALDPMIAVQRFIGGGQSTALLAIPFFVMLGSIMNRTGITTRMIKLAEVLTGHLPGALGQINVVLATLMGGLSASSLADAAMQTRMFVPEMTKRGYSKGFSAAVIASAAQVTPIIPPGIGLILYGYLADVSIGKMFMAGILPGLMICAILMITVHFVSKKRGYGAVRDRGPTFKEFAVSFKDAIWAIALVIVIIGGIRVGIFTPTEAGAIACIYVIFVGMFIYKETKTADVKNALIEAARSTGTIMLIIMAASAFAWFITWEQVAANITTMVTSFTTDPIVFLLIVNVFLLLVGMFIEGNAAMIVLIPLLMPTVHALGIDPVHFGIIMIINLAIGTITPPMGTIMLLVSGIIKLPIAEILKEMIPFYVAYIICLILITLIPQITLLLPNALG